MTALTLVCAVAALLGAWLAVRAGAFRGAIVAGLEGVLARELGASVRIGELAGPLYPAFEASRVELVLASGARLYVERLAARYAVTWRDGRLGLDVAHLTLDAPSMAWPADDSDDGAPPPAPTTEAAPSPPLDLVLRHVEVRRARLVWGGGDVLAGGSTSEAPGSASPSSRPAETTAAASLEAPESLHASRDGSLEADASQAPELFAGDARPAGAPFSAPPSDALHAEGADAPFSRSSWRVAATLDGEARDLRPLAERSWLPLTASLRVSADVATERVAEPVNAAFSLALDDRTLALSELVVHAGGGSAEGSAHAIFGETLEPLAADLRLELADIDLARVTPLERLRSSLAGPVHLAMRRAPDETFEEAHLEIEAALSGTAQALPLSSVTLSATRTRGVWSLASARLTGESLTLEASGVDLASGELEVRAAVPDLALLDVPLAVLSDALAREPAERLAPAGSLALDARVNVTSLTAEGRLRGTQLAIAGRSLGTLDAELAYASDTLEIRRAELRHGREVVRLQGRASAARAEALAVEVRDVSLAGLSRWLALPAAIDGTLSGDARVDGAWGAPSLDASVTVREPRLRDTGLGDIAARSLNVTARSDGDQLELGATVAAPWCDSLSVSASQRAPWLPHIADSPVAAEVDVRRLDLAWVSERSGALADGPAPALDGRLSGALTWHGRAAKPLPAGVDALAGELAGELTLAGVTAALGPPSGARTAPVTGRVTVRAATTGVRASRLSLGGSAAWSGWDVTWDAAWPDVARNVADVALREARATRGVERVTLRGELRGGAVRGGRVELDRVDVAAAAALLGVQRSASGASPGGAPEWGGEASVQLDVSGELRRPSLVGAGVWERARAAGIDLERIGFEVVGAGPELLLNARVLAQAGVVLDTHLRAPREILARPVETWGTMPGARASVEADDLDLRLIAPLLPRGLRGLRGTLVATVEASGSPSGPQLAGSVDLRGGALDVPGLRQAFSPIDARAVLERGRLRIETLSVQTPQGGVLSITGDVELADLVPRSVALSATLSRFDPARLRGLRFALDGAAMLTGPLDALDGAGELTLRDARLSPPAEDDPIWQDVRILRETETTTTLREAPGSLDRAFDQSRGRLVVRVPGRTWVSAGGAELELLGDVEIRKEPRDVPRFFGGLDIQRGRYQLGRRTLALARGSASLTGTEDFDPLLDARATTRVDAYDVTVQLGGYLSNPTIDLSSEPPLARNDVLALLLFGKPSYELEASRAAAIELVFAQLGGEIGLDDLRARLSRYLPFDTFSVDLGDESGARVEVGRYLRDDVFVRYGRSVGAEQSSDQVTVEWQLTPEVRVESQTSTDGSSGADVIWQKDY